MKKLLFLAVFAAHASADVLTVDDSGTAQFTDIPAAIAAAQDGDVVLVEPGAYSGFSVTDLDISVVGTPGTMVNGTIVVHGIPVAKTVMIRTMTVSQGGREGIVAQDVDGVLHVHNCVLRGGIEVSPIASASPGANCTNSNVFFTYTVFEGANNVEDFNDNFDGPEPGLVARFSRVYLHNCAARGGDGILWRGPRDAPGPGFDGAAGVHLFGSELFAVSSSARGGRGGYGASCSCGAGPCSCNAGCGPTRGGHGGPGITGDGVTGDVVLLDVLAVGGSGSPGGMNGCTGGSAPDGTMGQPLAVPATVLSDPVRTSRFRVHDCGGLRVRVDIVGVPGDQVYLASRDSAAYARDLALAGVWLPALPATLSPAPIATVPASGVAAVLLDLPPLGVGEANRRSFLQAVFVDGQGARVLGTPATIEVVSGMQPTCSATANSSGAAAVLEGGGTPSIVFNDVRLEVTSLPADRPGYFLMSLDATTGPLPPPSQGVLCLGAPVVRFAGSVLDSGPSGQVAFQPDLSQLPGGTTVQAGETWSFQYWFRDANPGVTSNTSNALRVPFCF
ncbi:MAG: hypothetical protein GY711_26210 [bacterium]|nr:hypothetical protein [bacterium]